MPQFAALITFATPTGPLEVPTYSEEQVITMLAEFRCGHGFTVSAYRQVRGSLSLAASRQLRIGR